MPLLQSRIDKVDNITVLFISSDRGRTDRAIGDFKLNSIAKGQLL